VTGRRDRTKGKSLAKTLISRGGCKKESIILLEGSKVLPARPSGSSSIKIKRFNRGETMA
jgi:hypothetical protein